MFDAGFDSAARECDKIALDYSDHQQWCLHLLQRLPEISWRLPYWPEGYSRHIPWGLFQKKMNWQPQDAIMEVQVELQQLMQESADSQRAVFLSQKILKKIEILVHLSRLMRPCSSEKDWSQTLTRQAYLAALQDKKKRLQQHHDALSIAVTCSSYPEHVVTDMNKILLQLQELEQLISLA